MSSLKVKELKPELLRPSPTATTTLDEPIRKDAERTVGAYLARSLKDALARGKRPR